MEQMSKVLIHQIQNWKEKKLTIVEVYHPEDAKGIYKNI